HAVQRNHFVETHPDTGASVIGVHVPYWREVLELSRRVAAATGLGYLGVDIVLDVAGGPMVLGGNARPGLGVQIAKGRGLLPRLEEIDREAGEDQDNAPAAKFGIVGTVGETYRLSA